MKWGIKQTTLEIKDFHVGYEDNLDFEFIEFIKSMYYDLFESHMQIV